MGTWRDQENEPTMLDDAFNPTYLALAIAVLIIVGVVVGLVYGAGS